MDIISLFSGAGGMDLGFKKAGFNLTWANEYDKHIWQTHETNFSESTLDKRSIRDIQNDDIPNCDGMIGGPPCQSFSEGGAKKGTSDPRGQLFWEYIRVLKSKQPLFFVAENVSGLLSKRHEKDLTGFLQAFNDAGYTVTHHLYNANDYGVPQSRERLVIVGYRKDLNKKFSIPNKQVKINLIDSIKELPESTPCKNGQHNQNLTTPNHEHMMGGFSSMYMSRNRVRTWNEPSFTILATARQIPIHPQAPKMSKIGVDQYAFSSGQENLYRRLSVRECANIQTFPSDFIFHYTRIEDGYKMVGNAVPVNLAYHIALQIKSDLFDK